MTKQTDPFLTGRLDGRPIGAVTAPDRISMVKNFDLAEIEAALELPNLQQSVLSALNRRRRQLIKEQRA